MSPQVSSTMWSERLPQIVGELSARWDLVEVEAPFPGRRSTLVTPVTDGRGRSLVLKVWRDTPWAAFEYAGLMYWNGRGCVRAVAFDQEHGAILEERVLPGLSLRATELSDREGTNAFIEVAAKLRVASGEHPKLPHLRTWLVRLEPGRLEAVSPQLLEEMGSARRVAEKLRESGGADAVLHADLHHKNLLFAESNGWVAIDPKGLVGPPEAEAAAFLRNPRQLLLEAEDLESLLHARTVAISEQLGDRPDRIAGWAYVLAVLSAAWALEDGEGMTEVEKWLRCAISMRDNYQHFVV